MNEVSAAVPLASVPEDASASRRKGRLHGAAVAGLREMIVTGALKPGQRLVEKQLCEHFAISRTPLREALKTLATEGLVRLLPNRSAVVAKLDLAEIEALYDVTATLEIHAASLACAQASDAGIAEFGALHYAMVARFHAGDLAAYFDINQQVHRKLVELVGNPVLLWVWDILAVRVRRAKFLPHLTPNRGDAAVEEHEAIFAALAARDTERLVACVRAHFDSGLAAIRRGPAAAPQSADAAPLQA